MARLGISPPRLRGGRLRSLAVAALMVGALGAILPSSHVAHAAALTPLTCVTPDNINSGASVSIAGDTGTLTGGTLILLVDNGKVTFDGATNSATGGGFACLPPGGDAFGTIDTTNSTDITIKDTQAGVNFGAIATCHVSDFTAPKLSLNNLVDSTDTVSTSCRTNVGTLVNVTVAVGGVGSDNGSGGTATPELGSGELFATGVVPILGLAFLRRRKARKASEGAGDR